VSEVRQVTTTTKGSSAAHSKLVDDTLLAVGALPFLRCWKRVVGLFYRVRKDPATGKVIEAVAVQVGIEGEPDIDGILRRWDGVGIRFGIECKTGNATQNPEQKKFQKMLEGMGGIYLLARSPAEALQLVRREFSRGMPEEEAQARGFQNAEAYALPLLPKGAPGQDEH
jgi:hypothetical protein